MIRIFLILLTICLVQSSESRFSPFRSAFRISGQSSLARNNEDDLNESHITLLPSATRSKPLQTTPFNMATTKKKIISTLLEMTENEISKKLNQLDSAENNEILSSNNKRFKSEPSTTVATERSSGDSATSSLFELSTEASAKQTSTTPASTTAKPRKQIKITTSSTRDSIAAAEAAALAIANMHSMALMKPSSNVNRVSNTASTKIPVHHHNPYNDYAAHDKINFDVNYRPTEAPAQPASSAPAKKSKDKNRESVKNLLNGLVNFVSSPLFTQAKPLIVSSFSTVSNALSANKNAASGSISSSASASGLSASASALNSNMLSKMFNSLRFAVLRRNEASTNANKNSKKKGKLNSAVNSSSTNNNQSNQSIMMNFLESLLKTREAFLSMASVPNKSKPVNKVGLSSSSNQSNKNTIKPYSNTILNLFRLLYKQPGLKQEARSI